MKIIGFILIALAGLNLVITVIGLSVNPNVASSNPEFGGMIGKQLIFDIGIIGLGIYLVSRANKKKEEEDKKNQWEQGLQDKE
jgi:hypothetical protein